MADVYHRLHSSEYSGTFSSRVDCQSVVWSNKRIWLIQRENEKNFHWYVDYAWYGETKFTPICFAGRSRFNEQHEYGVRYTVGGTRFERRCAKVGNGSSNIQTRLPWKSLSGNRPQAHSQVFNVARCTLKSKSIIPMSIQSMYVLTQDRITDRKVWRFIMTWLWPSLNNKRVAINK